MTPYEARIIEQIEVAMALIRGEQVQAGLYRLEQVIQMIARKPNEKKS